MEYIETIHPLENFIPCAFKNIYVGIPICKYGLSFEYIIKNIWRLDKIIFSSESVYFTPIILEVNNQIGLHIVLSPCHNKLLHPNFPFAFSEAIRKILPNHRVSFPQNNAYTGGKQQLDFDIIPIV